MATYDFFIAGRWRNKEKVQQVLDIVRASGKSAYCFIENSYEGEVVEFKRDGDPEAFMRQSEALPQDNPLLRKIFEADIAAERESEHFLLVLPAGNGAHIETGIAFGLGKKCYVVGEIEKAETLYCVFAETFPDIESLKDWLAKQ